MCLPFVDAGRHLIFARVADLHRRPLFPTPFHAAALEVRATASSQEEPFPTIHVVKQYVGDCKTTYYIHKKVRTEVLGEEDVATHTFYPWSREIPDWIANKSGKVLVSSGLLTDFTIAQCTLRYHVCVCAPLAAECIYTTFSAVEDQVVTKHGGNCLDALYGERLCFL